MHPRGNVTHFVTHAPLALLLLTIAMTFPSSAKRPQVKRVSANDPFHDEVKFETQSETAVDMLVDQREISE